MLRFWRVAGAAVVAVLVSFPMQGQAQEASVPSSPGGGTSGAGMAVPAIPALPPRSIEMIRSPDDRRELDTAKDPASKEAEGPRPQALRGSEQQPTDFQRFAAMSVGELLPIFGADLFAGAPSTFTPVIDAPPPGEYIVGAGDEIIIRGWGQVDIDVRAVVTREGTINIPRVGVLSIAGTRYEELPGRIKVAVSRVYRNFELSVSLGRTRSIQVFVVGHARRPGVYTVNSLSTLMNVLFASGGPAPTGSMRRIQLRRGNQLAGEFDLYDVLVKGDKSRDQRLLSGDIIFFPPVGPAAAIAGAVKTPAVFELRGEDTALRDLLAYAGGLTTTAATQSVLLERLEQRRGRVVHDLEWNESTLSMPLKGGDVVQVRAVTPRFENAVTLRGSVISPFRTAWRAGLRVADLIPDRSALVSNAYWSRVASRAFDASGPQLSRREGIVGQLEQQNRLRTEVENLVDEVNWDYAVIERLDKDRLEPRLIPFNLGKAVIERDPAQNLQLEPGDVVTVFSQKDIVAPSEKRILFVRIEGEVAVPGVYQARAGETLRQLVERAGGLTSKAYLFGAEFERESVRREQQAALEEITLRAEQSLDRAATERLSRALSPEDAQTARAQIEAQRLVIARLKALRATGRMVLDVRADARSIIDVPALPLEDGDRFVVPTERSSVGVYGAVFNQSNLVYDRDKTIGDYLAQAGGPSRSADTDSIYVLRANGSAVSQRQSGWFSSFSRGRLTPNDNIVVPEDYAPVSWVKELKDWSQIFYQFGLGVAALKVLRG